MKNKLLEIIIKLAEKNVDFVICGGVACVLQGCDRSTYDLDINIALTDENIKRAVNIFKKMNFYPRIPEPIDALLDHEKRSTWINDKNARVFTILSNKGDIQVDIFLIYDIDYEILKKNADRFTIDNKTVLVSCKEDLIKAKKNVDPVRDKDAYDIKQLEELIKNEK